MTLPSRATGALVVGVALGCVGTVAATSFAAGAPEPEVAEATRPAAPTCPGDADSLAELARGLAVRARQLDEREQTIELRERLISDAATKIEERLVQLEAAQAAIHTELDRVDVERQARVAALVKMVESNRAAAIAPMFLALETELAVDVLNGMNRSLAGKLLASLPSAHAARLAERMVDPVPLELQ